MRQETQTFISDLESFAGRKLSYPEDIGRLVDVAREASDRRTLEETAFQAKFVSRTYDLMKRIGAGAEGFDKLQAELTNSIRMTAKLLGSLASKLPESARVDFEQQFLATGESELENLMQLMRDLAWIKNWMLDGKALP